MIIEEPVKIKLELMSNEIEEIIDELKRTEHNIYEMLDYRNLIEKLNRALEGK